MADRFWLSTGDLKQRYEPVGLCATFTSVPAPAFGSINYQSGYAKCADQLVAEAKKFPGANGLIWISFSPQWFGAVGFIVFATGTAVRVSE